jgi:hypothetical protein
MPTYGRKTRRVGTMNKDTLADRAPYIAGLLDGESGFSINWNRRARRLNFRPLITLSMTHLGVITHIAETFQVSFKVEKTKKRKSYKLAVTTRDDITTILEALIPHLIVKKEHAQIILELIALKERAYTRENATRMAELYLRIRELSTKGPPYDPDKLKSELDKSIDSWFKE